MIRLKRVYDDAAPSDGQRILVERLWPRGLSKERAAIDLWYKEVAPSPGLRKWFDHDPMKWQAFKQRYWRELHARPSVIQEIRRLVSARQVTFIYAAHDTQHNAALALKEFLERTST